MDRTSNTPRRRFPSRYLLRSLVLVAAFSYCCLILRPTTSAFSHDSWSYYDLSQTVFGDFCRPATTRSFHERQGYSRSFPPLWPVLIALSNLVAPRGPQAAVVLAAIAALLTLVPLHRIVRACLPRQPTATVAAVFTWSGMLLYPPYWDEVLAGRAIPIAVLLLCTALAFLVHSNARPASSVGAGLSLGLACLARFDAAPFALLMLLSCLLPRVIPVRSRIALLAAFAIAISPWVVYSTNHYGSLWVSDNTAVALSATPAYALDYRAPSQTLATHPALWARRILANTGRLAVALARAVKIHAALAAAIAAAAVLWFVRRRPRRQPWNSMPALPIATAAAVLALSAQLLTGYLDPRYFSLACTLATGWAVCSIFARAVCLSTIARTGLVLLLLVGVHSSIKRLRREFAAPSSPPILSPQFLASLAQLPAPLLADRECHQLGAVSRHRSVCLPSDWERLTPSEKTAFFFRFSITHALIRSPAGAEAPFQIVPLRPGLDLRTK